MIGAIFVIVALLVLAGALAKIFDLKRRREAEAVQLQAQISEALLRDHQLFRLPIVATAHVPLWTGSPATLELSGAVPAPELRAAAVRIAELEASRIRPDVWIESRIGVTTNVGTRAA